METVWFLASVVILVVLDLYLSFFWLNRPAAWCILSPTPTLRRVNNTALGRADDNRLAPTAYLTNGFHVSMVYLQPRVVVAVTGILVLVQGSGGGGGSRTASLSCVALAVLITYGLATATKSNAWLWMTTILAAPTSGVALAALLASFPTTTLLATHAVMTVSMGSLLACIVSSSTKGRSLHAMDLSLGGGSADMESGVRVDEQQQQQKQQQQQPGGALRRRRRGGAGAASSEDRSILGIHFPRHRVDVHVAYVLTHVLVWTALAVQPDVPLLLLMGILYFQNVIVFGAGEKVERDVVEFVMLHPHVKRIMEIRRSIGGASATRALYADDNDEDGIPPTMAATTRGTSQDVSDIMKIPLPGQSGAIQFLEALLKTLRVRT